MDSFQSETLSSDCDSSLNSSCMLPNIQKESRKRQLRKTEEFIPPEGFDLDQQSIKQISKPKRQHLSFLPKIDDVVEDVHETKTTTITSTKSKKSRITNSSKKTVTLKLGKLKIERNRIKIKFKQFKPSSKKNIKPKSSHKTGKSPAEPDVKEVLSDTTEEFRSDRRMSLKLKKDKGGWKSVSTEEEEMDKPKVVLKDLYVKLIPLEKTNLLNDDQLRQLKYRRVSSNIASPLLSASYSNRHSSTNNRKRSSLGKENLFAKRISNTLNIVLPKKLLRKSGDLIKNSYFRPCTVILERLSPEKLKTFTTLPKNSKLEDCDEPFELVMEKSHGNSNEKPGIFRKSYEDFVDANNKADLKFLIKRKAVSLGANKTSSKKTSRRHTVSSAKMGTFKLAKSPENAEKCYSKFVVFNPEESSSPLTHSKASLSQSDKSADEKGGSSNRKSMSVFLKRLTNESETLGTPEFEHVNGTYEIIKNSSADKSNRISDQMPNSHSDEENMQGPCMNKSEEKSKLSRNSELFSEKENDKSNSQDLTYEVNDVKQNSVEAPKISLDKNGTYELEISDSNNEVSDIPKNILRDNRKGLSEPVKKRQAGDTSLKRTARRSYSLDIHVAQENNNEPQTVTGKKRRSTLTLDESVHDINILKSTCDPTGTPQKLTKHQKRRHSYAPGHNYKTQDVLFKKVLGKNLKSKSFYDVTSKNNSSDGKRDFSKVTIRKRSLLLEKTKIIEKHHRLNSTSSTSGLENTSPPWNRISEFNDGSTFEIDESQFNKTTSGLENTSLPWNRISEFNDGSTFEIDENQFNKTDDFKLASTPGEVSVLLTKDIDDDSPLVSSSSDSTDLTVAKSSKEKRRVTFGKSVKLDNSVLPNSSKTVTRKSMLKSKNSNSPGASNRRVTFSDISVIIIDDSDVSRGSPVPTQFPPDDDSDDSLQELSQYDHKSTAGRTPAKIKKVTDSPKYNKRRTVDRTPVASKSSPVAHNKKINSDGKMRLSNGGKSKANGSPVLKKIKPAATTKLGRMPNFAKLHKTLYSNMDDIEEYSQKKAKRAQLLLSGHKPVRDTSSKKPVNKGAETAVSQIRSKKQLTYPEASTSKQVPPKQNIHHKKAQLVSSTPKGKKNEAAGYTRYGFKVTADKALTKKDQVIAVANKTKPQKLKKEENRTEIKGVRSNRRFELLMKMREKKQK